MGSAWLTWLALVTAVAIVYVGQASAGAYDEFGEAADSGSSSADVSYGDSDAGYGEDDDGDDDDDSYDGHGDDDDGTYPAGARMMGGGGDSYEIEDGGGDYHSDDSGVDDFRDMVEYEMRPVLKRKVYIQRRPRKQQQKVKVIYIQRSMPVMTSSSSSSGSSMPAVLNMGGDSYVSPVGYGKKRKRRSTSGYTTSYSSGSSGGGSSGGYGSTSGGYGGGNTYGGAGYDYHSTSHLPQAQNWWYDVGAPDHELYQQSDGYAALSAIRDQFSIYGGPTAYKYPYGAKRTNYLKHYYNKYPSYGGYY